MWREHGQEAAGGGGDDSFAAVEDEAHRRQVTTAGVESCRLPTDEAEREVWRPGHRAAVSFEQIEPAHGIVQHERRRHLQLVGAKIDTQHVVHHQTADMVQREPVQEAIGGGEVVRLRGARRPGEQVTMRERDALW